MKYLTYDEDASLRILTEIIEEQGLDLIKTMVVRSSTLVDYLEECELPDLPPITITACVDHDGVKYESLEMIANMRFIQNGETYLSNGYFAINMAEAIEQQEETLKTLVKGDDYNLVKNS